jgi:hypothetical protein
MKRKDFFKYIGVASMGAALGGCDFLDVVPNEKATIDDAFQNPEAAKDSLYSCYSFLPQLRAYNNSVSLVTADELVIPFTQSKVLYFPRGEYTASSPVFPFWNNYYKGIRHCYIFLNKVDETPQLSQSNIVDFKAQVNFLLGYYYFLLIRMYGPAIIHKKVPNIDESIKDFKSRTPLENSVKFAISKFEEAAKNLPATRSGHQYGLATSVQAKSLKAKLLLYAASPLFNGGGEDGQSLYADFKSKKGEQLIPTTYEKEKWKKAAAALKEAINAAHAAGHQLYHYNTSVNSPLPSDPVEKDLRFTICDPQTKEIIMPGTLPEGQFMFQNNAEPFYTDRSFNGFSPVLEMVEAFYTENGLPIDKDPQFDYNDRYSKANGPNGTTMKLHLHRETRFDAWVSYQNSYFEILKGSENEVLCGFRKQDNCGRQNRKSNYSLTGYLSKKGVHPLSDDTSFSFVNYPWSKLRLADLYLEYAEALIEYGQDFGTAKTYIDKVRKRAGIPTVDQAWAPIGGANDKKTLRSIVRQERRIEFYLENQRFWDTRRWMTAENVLNHPLHGLNINATTYDDFFKVTQVQQKRTFQNPSNYLMPIPINEVNRNPNIVQNPGY